jgi:hypothetical protein
VEQFSLSVVLPVSGRADSLAATVAECLALRAQPGVDLEIIIADDASDPPAAALADRLAATHSSVAVIHYPRRRGYRQTLWDAWGAARGRYVAALDSAGPAAAADLARLLPAAELHAAVLGYRVPPPRHLNELAFAAAVRARLTGDMRDPALGLGLFRADLRELLSPSGPDALAHAELYAAALGRGLPVTQVAVGRRAGRTGVPSLTTLGAALAAEPAVGDQGRGKQGVAAAAGMILAACGLWLLRRRRRP